MGDIKNVKKKKQSSFNFILCLLNYLGVLMVHLKPVVHVKAASVSEHNSLDW